MAKTWTQNALTGRMFVQNHLMCRLTSTSFSKLQSLNIWVLFSQNNPRLRKESSRHVFRWTLCFCTLQGKKCLFKVSLGTRGLVWQKITRLQSRDVEVKTVKDLSLLVPLPSRPETRHAHWSCSFLFYSLRSSLTFSLDLSALIEI